MKTISGVVCVFIMCLRVAPGSAAGEQERWFSSSADDYAMAPALAGTPLRAKSRFVRVVSGGVNPSPGRFIAACAGGEMTCEMRAAPGVAARVKDMKKGTPIVLHGTLDAHRNIFLVNGLEQGWGRDRVRGGS